MSNLHKFEIGQIRISGQQDCDQLIAMFSDDTTTLDISNPILSQKIKDRVLFKEILLWYVWYINNRRLDWYKLRMLANSYFIDGWQCFISSDHWIFVIDLKLSKTDALEMKRLLNNCWFEIYHQYQDLDWRLTDYISTDGYCSQIAPWYAIANLAKYWCPVII